MSRALLFNGIQCAVYLVWLACPRRYTLLGNDFLPVAVRGLG